MIPIIRFYRDQSDRPRVQAEPELASLADYLANDLQDEATATEVLTILQKAEETQEINGNSFTVIFQPDQITLESLFDDQAKPCQLPKVEFQLLLKAWIQFLDNNSLLSVVPVF